MVDHTQKSEEQFKLFPKKVRVGKMLSPLKNALPPPEGGKPFFIPPLKNALKPAQVLAFTQKRGEGGELF